jgi:hypothetical protein
MTAHTVCLVPHSIMPRSFSSSGPSLFLKAILERLSLGSAPSRRSSRGVGGSPGRARNKPSQVSPRGLLLIAVGSRAFPLFTPNPSLLSLLLCVRARVGIRQSFPVQLLFPRRPFSGEIQLSTLLCSGPCQGSALSSGPNHSLD